MTFHEWYAYRQPFSEWWAPLPEEPEKGVQFNFRGVRVERKGGEVTVSYNSARPESKELAELFRRAIDASETCPAVGGTKAVAEPS